MSDKAIHITGAIVTIVLGGAVILWKPVLVEDASNTLGTFGTFATAYGVVFAIIELRRAKEAWQLAKQEAERVFNAVISLVTAREIIECQHIVQMAAVSIDENKRVSTTILVQIIKLYSQVFHAELLNDKSIHRKNRSTIESYYFTSQPRAKATTSPKKTQQALLSMAGQLAELQGSTKNFTEYKNDTKTAS